MIPHGGRGRFGVGVAVLICALSVHTAPALPKALASIPSPLSPRISRQAPAQRDLEVGRRLPVALSARISPRAPAQQREQQPFFSISAEIVRLNVAVFDRSGAPVADLEAGDFVVREDGVEKPVSYFAAPRDAPLEIAFLLDFSTSMLRDAPSVKEDALGFLEALSPRDCVFLLPFRTRVDAGVWGSPDSPRLRRMIEATPLGGDTALYDSVLTGLAELSPAANRDPRRAPPGAEPPAVRPGCALIGSTPGDDARPISRRRALIVLTDGNDQGSVAAYTDVLRAALEAKVPIFPVAVGAATRYRVTSRLSANRNRARRMLNLSAELEALADASGGRLLRARGMGSLREAYQELLELLRASYVIGYALPIESGDDRQGAVTYHRVEIELQRPGLSAVTRSGYYHATGVDAVTATNAVAAGLTLLEDRRVEGALHQFDLAVAASPYSWEPHYYRGVVLGTMDRLLEAHAATVRAVDLAPEEPRAHELAALTLYRAGQLADAWSHAIRAQQAGADMAPTFALLRSLSPAPADLEQRLAAPKIAVDDIDLGLLSVSRVADVVLVVNLQPTSRAIRRLLSASKSLALVPREADPDYLVRIQVRDWSRDSGEVRLDLSLHERDGDRRWRVELRRRLTLNDTPDAEALTTTLEPFVRDVEERLEQRDR